MKYKLLEHTGDAKIKAFGETKEELFLNAMLGMNALLKPKIKNKRARIRKIKIESTDTSALLVDFLNEVNYLRQVNMEIYDKARFTKFFGTLAAGSGQVELEAELKGYQVAEFGEDIKAVTFHELDVHKTPEGPWETIIVFDI